MKIKNNWNRKLIQKKKVSNTDFGNHVLNEDGSPLDVK
jgi:hypothetical protein